MRIDNLHSAHAGPGSDLLKNKLLSVRQLQKRQVLRGRTYEDEIVVLGVVQGKQAAQLDANLLAMLLENIVESVKGQNFAHSRVVVRNHCSVIPGESVLASPS